LFFGLCLALSMVIFLIDVSKARRIGEGVVASPPKAAPAE
jgi:hypothetical protein